MCRGCHPSVALRGKRQCKGGEDYRVRSTEYGELRRPCKGANRSRAPVQRWKSKRQGRLQSTEGRQVREPCKGAKVEKWKGKMRRRRRVQSAGSSTEDGGETGAKVQIGAELLCKGGKVNDKTGRGGAEAEEITGYRVQRTDLGDKRQARLARSANPTSRQATQSRPYPTRDKRGSRVARGTVPT
jgi:hypothetical protein